MRVLVTGAMNPVGAAIITALAEDGHKVRAFGVRGDDPFQHENVKVFPGTVEVPGSIEPALSEREVLVHVACFDAPGKDKKAHAVHLERGTLYTVYGAEREQVDILIHLTPQNRDRVFGEVHQRSCEIAEGARGNMHVRVLHVQNADDAVARVKEQLKQLPLLGSITGGNDNAVTA